jgi:long-chain acyl-CoA synthetase
MEATQAVALREVANKRSAPRRDADAAIERTIPALFLAASRERRSRIAMRWKRRGIWEAVGWAEYVGAVREVGCALIAFGLQPGDRVAILSENRPEWLYVDLAAQSAGCVPVGVDLSEPIERAAEIVNDCGARILFVDCTEQLDALVAGLAKMPALECVVHFDARVENGETQVQLVDLSRFRADGRRFDEQHPQRWEAEIGRVRADDIATIIYDPGPGAARLTHRDLVAELDAVAQRGPRDDGDEQLSVLPLSQWRDRCFDGYRPLASGAVVNFAEGLDNVVDGFREVAPHVVMATPAIWEMLHATIVAAISDASPLGQLGYRLALEVGRARADCLDSGRPQPPGSTLRFLLARLLVLNRVKTMIGLRRARVLLRSGGTMPLESLRWYRALGLNVVSACDDEGWRPLRANDSLAHKESRW